MRFRLSPEWKQGAIIRAAAIKKTARDYNPFAPMIYRTAHITDCARHMLAALPVALAVGGLIFLSQLLADAAANALPLAALGQFLALAVVKYIPQLLTASLFVGVMLAFGRAFQTREMAAWFAAGAGLRHFVLPGALFALPSIVLVAIFSVSVSPWAVRAAADLRARLLHDINPESLRPGEFGVAPGGAYTYFIGDERDSDGNIFIVRNREDAHEVIITQAARKDSEGGEFIALQNGVLYRLPRLAESPRPPEITAFEAMQIHLPSAQNISLRPRGRPFADLRWDNNRERAEWIWRINQPLAALFLTLLAPLLNDINPRRGGQGRGFFAAMFLFTIYLNLLYFVRDGMSGGEMHFIVGLLVAPLSLLAVALLLRRARR